MPNLHLLTDPAYLPCVRCGYDLRGSTAELCPECGGSAAGDRSRSTIPWAHRHAIGRLNGYLRTAWMATVHPARLAADVSRPQNFRDARMFQLATALAAGVPGVALLAGFALARDGFDLKPVLLRFGPLAVWPELLMMMVCGAGWSLFSLATAGVQSYWFHPRRLPIELQNRLLALSYYSTAPMALVAVPMAGLAGLQVLVDLNDAGLISPGMIGAIKSCTVLSTLLMLAMVMRSTLVLLRHTAGCSRWQALGLLLGLPLAWAVLTGLCLVVLPGLALIGLLMVLSLR